MKVVIAGLGSIGPPTFAQFAGVWGGRVCVATFSSGDFAR